MKKITLFFIAVFIGTATLSAATGWYNDFLSVKVNGVGTANNYYLSDSNPASGAAALHGANFGTVSTLEITGCDMKYWSDTQDRTGGSFFYEIKSSDGLTQIVAPVETIWDQIALVGNDFQGTKTTTLNITNAILANGTYQLHVWAKSWGTGQGDSWLSNSSANYVATFTVSRPVIVSGATGIVNNTSFETLKAAVDALNANPDQSASDVEIKIAGNTTEPANFGLAVNTGTKKITIRPDADVDRTITFTQTAANGGPVGHFLIGYLTNGLASAIDDSYHISTNNVIIDGFSQGGTTKRLKLTTTTASLASSSLVTVFGGCDNISIKNCILENNSTASTPRCIYYYVRKGTSIDVSPTNLTIENNNIRSMSSSTGQGISGVNSGASPVSRATNMTIKNNYVIAQGRCMEIHYYGTGLNVLGNEIKLSQQGNSGTTNYGLWVRTGVGPINIIGNKFTETSTKEAGTSGTLGTRAISCSAYEHNIYNNMFSGMDRSGTASVNVSQAYIFVVGTGRIYHNTFYMPALSSPSTPGTYQAINNSTSLNVEIKNNIFISNEDVKSQFVSNVNNISENNIYFLRIGNTNAKIVSTYSTLSAYQSANPTKDIYSKNVDVNFVDAAAGDLKITGDSEHDDRLAVPLLGGVLTDMYGTSRAAYTYAGAHEGAMPFYWTGIDKSSYSTGSTIIRTSNGIEIKLDKPTTVELYTTNGVLIDKKMVDGNYIHSLNSGVYVVRINGVASKFVK